MEANKCEEDQSMQIWKQKKGIQCNQLKDKWTSSRASKSVSVIWDGLFQITVLVHHRLRAKLQWPKTYSTREESSFQK